MRYELSARGRWLVSVVLVMFAAGGYLLLQTPAPRWDGASRPWLWIDLLLGGGIALLILDRVARRRHKLIVDDNGIEVRTILGTTRIAWDRVSHYHYRSLVENGLEGFGNATLIGWLGSRLLEDHKPKPHYAKLAVVGLDGARVDLDGGRFIEIAAALDFAFEQLHAQLRPRVRDYAPFGVTDAALSHERRELPLGALTRVVVAEGYVRAWHGDLTWAYAAMPTVRNSMLLVEELLSRGVRVEIGLRAPLPRFAPGPPPPVAHQIPPARSVQR